MNAWRCISVGLHLPSPKLASSPAKTASFLPTVRIRTLLTWFTGSWLAFCPLLASAEPFEATGEAKQSKTSVSPAVLQRQAIRQALQNALQAALSRVPSRGDQDARRAILRAPTVWTGAYRVLNIAEERDRVRVNLEVDIDVERLAKRLAPRTAVGRESQATRYRVTSLDSDETCGERAQMTKAVRNLPVFSERSATKDARIVLHCSTGAIRHTFTYGARVEASLWVDESMIAQAVGDGLASEMSDATANAVDTALKKLSGRLSAPPEPLKVRVESPLPSKRVRWLESAMVDDIRGVRSVSVVGIEPDGTVLLGVEGGVSAEALERGLRALHNTRLPMRVLGIDARSTVSVRLLDASLEESETVSEL